MPFRAVQFLVKFLFLERQAQSQKFIPGQTARLRQHRKNNNVIVFSGYKSNIFSLQKCGERQKSIRKTGYSHSDHPEATSIKFWCISFQMFLGLSTWFFFHLFSWDILHSDFLHTIRYCLCKWLCTSCASMCSNLLNCASQGNFSLCCCFYVNSFQRFTDIWVFP